MAKLSRLERMALKERYDALCGEVTVTKAKRACLQCGKTLPVKASPREKWCEKGCFKAWFLARNPDYVPMPKLELVNAYDETFKEVPPDGAETVAEPF